MYTLEARHFQTHQRAAAYTTKLSHAAGGLLQVVVLDVRYANNRRRCGNAGLALAVWRCAAATTTTTKQNDEIAHY